MTPLIRRRPLLRTAAVGGGAYMLGKRRAEGQEREEGQQQPTAGADPQASAPAAEPAGGISSDAVERLKELGQLHDQGILTDAEFNQQKAKLLAG